jgi:uncharacterized membrane protein (UPF0127 family)
VSSCLNDRLHFAGPLKGGARERTGVVVAVSKPADEIPLRLARLHWTTLPGGRRVPVAASLRSRLLGLALLDRESAGAGLLIPRCRAVHTFGMRFPLELRFLDAAGGTVSVRRSMPPRRFAFERRARAVLELPAGKAT